MFLSKKRNIATNSTYNSNNTCDENKQNTNSVFSSLSNNKRVQSEFNESAFLHFGGKDIKDSILNINNNKNNGMSFYSLKNKYNNNVFTVKDKDDFLFFKTIFGSMSVFYSAFVLSNNDIFTIKQYSLNLINNRIPLYYSFCFFIIVIIICTVCQIIHDLNNLTEEDYIKLAKYCFLYIKKKKDIGNLLNINNTINNNTANCSVISEKESGKISYLNKSNNKNNLITGEGVSVNVFNSPNNNKTYFIKEDEFYIVMKELLQNENIESGRKCAVTKEIFDEYVTPKVINLIELDESFTEVNSILYSLNKNLSEEEKIRCWIY